MDALSQAIRVWAQLSGDYRSFSSMGESTRLELAKAAKLYAEGKPADALVLLREYA